MTESKRSLATKAVRPPLYIAHLTQKRSWPFEGEA